MKIVSLFNNKGGAGKTALSYHLAHLLTTPIAEGGLGKKVLLIDFDPQSNLTLLALGEAAVEKIWEEENAFIEDGFQNTKNNLEKRDFEALLTKPRTIHFLLKPTEEGISDEETLPPPFHLNKTETFSILPGRLSIQSYESILAERWTGAYLGNAISIRTITKIRKIAEAYAKTYNYDYVMMETAPNLGALNKVILSTADGLMIPCTLDLFSLYGIKTMGKALTFWEKEFYTLSRIQQKFAKDAPKSFVTLLGYTIFDATQSKHSNPLDGSSSHAHYALRFSKAIEDSFKTVAKKHASTELLKNPIGEKAMLHTYPIYDKEMQKTYAAFAIDLLQRVAIYLEPVSLNASN
jgi:cellulose biosynthesis protein BcsQ